MLLGLNSPLKIGIFFGYMFLWVSAHLLIYSSRLAGAPAYNPTSVVLLTELAKYALALSLYLKNDGSFSEWLDITKANTTLLLKYFVPSLLYCFYNNLIYINLRTFDPGTYNVLMQLKIVLTGLVYQVVFARRLNRNQWAAIILITVGCMVKESSKLGEGFDSIAKASAWGWMLIFSQALCSVLASVYTEALLKGSDDARVTTNLQNTLMYLASMVCNVGYMVVDGTLAGAMSLDNAAAICQPSVIGCIAIMSSVGIVTGFFLKHLDSVLKAIASAIEIVFTMVFSAVLFGVAINLSGLLAAIAVGVGVAFYSRPVEQKQASSVGGLSASDIELSAAGGDGADEGRAK